MKNITFRTTNLHINPLPALIGQEARDSPLVSCKRACILERYLRTFHFRANTGFELAEEILPLLPSLGATTSDVMVINFAVWQNKYVLFTPACLKN